jgi:decaprenyl-phosphate phosphoribosyltransferase
MGQRAAVGVDGPIDLVVLRRPGRLPALLRGMRPRHWAKNVLVFAAPGAAGVLTRPEVLGRASVAFVALCLAASAVYLVNDVIDAPSDRRHATKRARPVAAGVLDERTALVAAGVLLAAAAAAGGALGIRFALVVGLYVVLSLAYSLRLQRVPVIDLAIVASGFVIRAVAGGIATGVAPSAWFLILACSAAAFVVAGKRLSDVLAGHEGSVPYPAAYLRGIWVLAGSVSVTAYCLWAFAVPHTVDGVAWSQVSIIPFALAILRYAYGIEQGEAAAPELVFLRDRVLLGITLAWVVVYAAGVYVK